MIPRNLILFQALSSLAQQRNSYAYSPSMTIFFSYRGILYSTQTNKSIETNCCWCYPLMGSSYKPR